MVSLGLEPKDRTMKWATHLEIGNRMPTIKDIYQHLGLLEEWGERNAYSKIKIRKGETVIFVGGKAVEQKSYETGKSSNVSTNSLPKKMLLSCGSYYAYILFAKVHAYRHL